RPGLRTEGRRPARRGHPHARGDPDARNPRRTLGFPADLCDDHCEPHRRMGAAEAVPDGLGPNSFGISTVAIATELPDLGSLRDEQRILREQLARLRGRLRLELALEFAVDAAIALVATAAVLVFLDWWFRFGLAVR